MDGPPKHGEYIAWAAICGEQGLQLAQTDDIPTVLLLGQNGSTAQALLAEMKDRGLNVRVVLIASVPHDRLDVSNSATALVAAADAIWGSRLVSACDGLSWASKPFYKERSQGPKRRLVLADIWLKRPWQPGQQHTVTIPRSDCIATIGLLIPSEEAQTVRDTLLRLRTRLGRADSFATTEFNMRTQGPTAGTGEWATEHTQFIISQTRDRPIEQLEMIQHALQLSSADFEPLWWSDYCDKDAILLPVDRGSMNRVIQNLRRGVSFGFPHLAAQANLQGILISGISAALLPGLLQAIGLGTEIHSLASTLRSGMSYPLRLANHGPALEDGRELWKISAARISNEHEVVIDRTDIDPVALRRAIEMQLCHTVAITRVQAQNPNTTGFEDAWLVRIPNAASSSFRRWTEAGMKVSVGEVQTTARPAPLTRACASSGYIRLRHEEAATAQLAWARDANAPTSHAMYARIQPKNERALGETVRLQQASGKGFLAGRKTASTRLPGVQIGISAVQARQGDQNRDAGWAMTLIQNITPNSGNLQCGTEVQRHETRPIALRSRETLVIALAGGSDLHVRSYTHDARIFCPTPQIIIIKVDSRAGSAAASAGWDDEVWISSDTVAEWAYILEEARLAATDTEHCSA